jgi:hypothetical protein
MDKDYRPAGSSMTAIALQTTKIIPFFFSLREKGPAFPRRLGKKEIYMCKYLLRLPGGTSNLKKCFPAESIKKKISCWDPVR